MILPFSEALRRLRIEKGYSQQRLADALHVDRSTVTKWETGDRVPDAVMISLLSDCLGVNVAELLHASEKSAARPVVMIVDDENIILRGSVPILEKAIPDAEIAAFRIPAEAVAYAKVHPVSLAFLDIKMGRVSGLNVCRELLAVNPRPTSSILRRTGNIPLTPGLPAPAAICSSPSLWIRCGEFWQSCDIR